MTSTAYASNIDTSVQQALLNALCAVSDFLKRTGSMEAGTWDADRFLACVLYADAISVLSRRLWASDRRYLYFRRRFKTFRTRSLLSTSEPLAARSDDLEPARIALEKEVARYRGRLAFEIEGLRGILPTEPVALGQLLREEMPILTHEVRINLDAVLNGRRDSLSDHMCPLVRRYSIGIALMHGKTCRVFDDLASILEQDWRDRGLLELTSETSQRVIEWWEKNRSEAEACFRDAS